MKRSAESIGSDAPGVQSGEGGAIPTSALHFQVGQDAEAKELVLRFHYSKRLPGNTEYVGTLHTAGGLFGNMGPAIAACMFSSPPTRWSEPVLELTRLVREPGTRPPLTRLIGLLCQRIRKNGKWPLLVSFADKMHGHHGGVYQAASWRYGGLRGKRMDGLTINGIFWPGRSCNANFGTRSPRKLRLLKPQDAIEPHYDEGKHLYWRALNRAGKERAMRLGLKSLPYPKPKGGSPT